MLVQILGANFNGGKREFTDEQRGWVRIVNDRIYRHQTIRVNYTTYDGRRDQDSINTRTHADIMVLNPKEKPSDDLEHPYWYGRVYGVFHANVKYTGPGPQHGETLKTDFLWIRWFKRDRSAPGGFKTRRLHRVRFIDGHDPRAFGFISPDAILRGVHLIPAFHHGKLDDENEVQWNIEGDHDKEQADWRYYYVNM